MPIPTRAQAITARRFQGVRNQRAYGLMRQQVDASDVRYIDRSACRCSRCVNSQVKKEILTQMRLKSPSARDGLDQSQEHLDRFVLMWIGFFAKSEECRGRASFVGQHSLQNQPQHSHEPKLELPAVRKMIWHRRKKDFRE